MSETDTDRPADDAPSRAVRKGDVDPVPVLPRGRGMRWLWSDLFRIAFLLIMLVALIATRQQCADGVARFMGSFDPVDAGAPADPPVPEGYELLTPERAAELFGPDAGAPDAN